MFSELSPSVLEKLSVRVVCDISWLSALDEKPVVRSKPGRYPRLLRRPKLCREPCNDLEPPCRDFDFESLGDEDKLRFISESFPLFSSRHRSCTILKNIFRYELKGMRCSVSVLVDFAVTICLLFPNGDFLMSSITASARAVLPMPDSPIRKTIDDCAFNGSSRIVFAAERITRFSSVRPVKGNVDLFFFATLTASTGSKIGTGLSYPFALTGGKLLKTNRPSACARTASSTKIPLFTLDPIKRAARFTGAPITANSCRCMPPTTPQ
mmetsp:Transcript_22518/g.62536  ORF Transcript_22518/g.62536 Transcript_22518/m.62536 type:complete len:267 (+) Transcript_22518:4663-5463(+)